MSRLPYCCVAAEFDGFTPEEHARVCREPRPDSEPAVITPTTPEEGGPQL